MEPIDQNYQETKNDIEKLYPSHVAMPSWLFCDGRLKASEKMLVMIVGLYGRYRPNYDEIEWLIGISQKTTQQTLRKLEKLGFVKTIKNDGRGKIYCLARGF